MEGTNFRFCFFAGGEVSTTITRPSLPPGFCGGRTGRGGVNVLGTIMNSPATIIFKYDSSSFGINYISAHSVTHNACTAGQKLIKYRHENSINGEREANT